MEFYVFIICLVNNYTLLVYSLNPLETNQGSSFLSKELDEAANSSRSPLLSLSHTHTEHSISKTTIERPEARQKKQGARKIF